MLGDDRDRVVAREWRLAGEHLVEEGPERIEVGLRPCRLAERLLGGQIGDRADQRAAADPGSGLGRGQAEVAKSRVAVVVDPHVCGLQVAVNDAAGVGVLERAGDVGGDLDRPSHLEAPAGRREQASDVATRHVAADDEGIAGVLTRVEDRDDLRVVAELSHRIGFAARPGLHAGADAGRVVQRHGDLGARPRVLGEIDALTHCPAPGSAGRGSGPRSRSGRPPAAAQAAARRRPARRSGRCRTSRRIVRPHDSHCRRTDTAWPYQVSQPPTAGLSGMTPSRPQPAGTLERC